MTPQRTNDDGARWWIGAVYLVLLALVVPWYWPAGDTRHFFGVPLWAIVTLLAVLVTSIFTAWIYPLRELSGREASRVFVQTPWLLPELRRSADGRVGGAAGR
jgi:hypothetical protein